MPTAAIIPVLIIYIIVVAINKLLVGFKGCCFSPITSPVVFGLLLREIRMIKVGFCKNRLA